MTTRKHDKEFNRIVKIVSSYLGNYGTTTDTELTDAGNYYLNPKLFKGVHASDQIPRLKNSECCIVNLDRSYEPGSHWIALYCHKSDYIVFDSFGRPTYDIIPKYSFSQCGGMIIDAEYDADQRFEQEDCGQRSLAFLIFLYCNSPEMALLL